MIEVSTAAAAGVARITLNRPEKRNAITSEMMSALRDALQRAGDDSTVRVLLIRGAGKDFCAGIDLSEVLKSAEDEAASLASARRLGDLYIAMRRHPKPIVAAVQGRALGGGAGIATACDLILAAESAQFGYPEVKLGFIPAIVATMLRRAVNERQAMELALTGEPLSAPRAYAIGLINRVYPDAEFDTERRALRRRARRTIRHGHEPEQGSALSDRRDELRSLHRSRRPGQRSGAHDGRFQARRRTLSEEETR